MRAVTIKTREVDDKVNDNSKQMLSYQQSLPSQIWESCWNAYSLRGQQVLTCSWPRKNKYFKNNKSKLNELTQFELYLKL